MILNRSGRLLTNVDRYPQTDTPLAAQLGGCARILGRMRAETGTDLGYRADEDLFDPIGTYIVPIPSLQLAMSVRTAENRSKHPGKIGAQNRPFYDASIYKFLYYQLSSMQILLLNDRSGQMEVKP